MKAIFFDIGGVVIKDTNLKEEVFRVFHGSDQQQVWDLLNAEVLPACRGGMPLVECWRVMAGKLGLEIEDSQLDKLWIDDFRGQIAVNEEVMQLATRLKSRCSYMGVISNTIHEHAVILKDLKVYDPFNPVVLSHEVGLTKDSKEIFQHALQLVGADANEVIFIDDVPKFAKVAAEVGMHSIVFQNAAQLEQDLQGFNLL